VGFHDWSDYEPFCRKKFLSLGQRRAAEAEIEAAMDFFKISFPEFTIRDNRTLLRVLRDRRVADLRKLIDDAVRGIEVFDADFARRTLLEALHVREAEARYRRVVSFLAAPLALIPWFGEIASRAAEEAVSGAINHRLEKHHRWLFMFSEITGTC
jgi:hypothetical protein